MYAIAVVLSFSLITLIVYCKNNSTIYEVPHIRNIKGLLTRESMQIKKGWRSFFDSEVINIFAISVI